MCKNKECPNCLGTKKVFNGFKMKNCNLCSESNNQLHSELANSFINQKIKVFNAFS